MGTGYRVTGVIRSHVGSQFKYCGMSNFAVLRLARPYLKHSRTGLFEKWAKTIGFVDNFLSKNILNICFKSPKFRIAQPY